ncbi:MAG: hypothetical protein U0Z75_05280 [Deinococcaceae bacterium]
MGRPLRLVDLTPKEDQDLKRIEFNPKLSEKVRLGAIIHVLIKTVPLCPRRCYNSVVELRVAFKLLRAVQI